MVLPPGEHNEVSIYALSKELAAGKRTVGPVLLKLSIGRFII